MKRSDMIESIVYHCLSWDGLDTSGVPLEDIANDILTHVEKCGMLPPEGKEKYYSREDCEYKGIHEWDTEYECE